MKKAFGFSLCIYKYYNNPLSQRTCLGNKDALSDMILFALDLSLYGFIVEFTLKVSYQLEKTCSIYMSISFFTRRQYEDVTITLLLREASSACARFSISGLKLCNIVHFELHSTQFCYLKKKKKKKKPLKIKLSNEWINDKSVNLCLLLD
jgi:hypothetical protein